MAATMLSTNGLVSGDQAQVVASAVTILAGVAFDLGHSALAARWGWK
jgi:hypothetical protein